MATRRSPRSVERLCNGLVIPDFTPEQTALLLALAHSTGWTAERISKKLRHINQIALTPEMVWRFHSRWVEGREQGEHLSVEEVEVIKTLLRSVDIDVGLNERPLNRTLKPTTVKFAKSWSPKSPDDLILFPGYNGNTRKDNKAYLIAHGRPSVFAKLTPIEDDIIPVFGNTLTLLIRNVLKQWDVAMREKLRGEPYLKQIDDRQYVKQIMEYLQLFQCGYEQLFGRMEPGRSSTLGDIRDKTVYISSTGYGVKVFLGLMLADRLTVVDQRRKNERERVGFVFVDIDSLPENYKDCPICRDPMGIKNPEGAMELPTKMIICCGQVMGDSCLKRWLIKPSNADDSGHLCPYCRHEFPPIFVEKLFAKATELQDFDERDKRIDLARDLTGTSPEMMPQVNIDMDGSEEAMIKREEDSILDEDDFVMEG